jgi:hypothetical protein
MFVEDIEGCLGLFDGNELLRPLSGSSVTVRSTRDQGGFSPYSEHVLRPGM